MSNVINIGWEPLQLMMRDINNVPEEFRHLPFTDEVNQLLLSALSSGEHVQNNYYGVDSTYYRSRYGSSDQNSPCPPSSNVYSNNSSLSPPQAGQLSPPQQQAKAPKIQPPSIQLPNTQHPNAQLSPRLLHQNQILPQLQNIPPQNKISQPQQTQMQQRYQQQVPKNQSTQQQQMQMPQLPPQQLQQMQQMQQPQQNTISSLDPPRTTALQAHLLQQLQQQRQAQQQTSQQVKQPSPSPPQQSRPSSPTQVSLQRPPSPPDMVQQPQQQRDMSPTRQLLPTHLMNQQLPTGYPSHLPVLPQFQSQMLPHLNNPMLNQSHLMNMQQMQQYQLQATQQVPSSLQPTQSSQSQQQQQQQQSPQQTTQQTMKPPTTTVAPVASQAPAQQPQFMRAVPQPPSSSSSPSSIPMEPLSPTVYQFINVKDEQQDNKTKPLTEKQKNRRRASQNLASRNYRQRKKEYITTMEDRAQELEHQNELLRRQMNQKEVIISKLSKEARNSTLRANANLNEEKYSHDEDIEDAYSPIDSNMQELILKLERTIKLEKVDTDDEAESTGLKSTLQAFYGSLHERHDRYTNQVKEIVNPCTQAKLSALYADPTSPFDNGFTENDDDWWESYSEDADIGDEQAVKIQEIRRDHHIEFQRLRTERRDLNKDIRDYYKMVFSSAIGGKEELEADVKMEELVAKLNFLKDNLEDEKRLILQTHAAMSKILTPKQEAMLVTRSYNKVVRSNATIQMVTNMYEVVLKENALAKCCAPGWEVL